MAESDREEPAQRLRREPQVLANIPPSAGQRRTARIFVLALLAILAATWPFATLKLPAIDAFVPFSCSALFVSDIVTAVLLFGQFSILRQRALLVIANGYVFSALIVVAHALAFPGAFSHSGLFGSGLQSAVGSIGCGIQDCRSPSSAMRCSRIRIVRAIVPLDAICHQLERRSHVRPCGCDVLVCHPAS